MLGFKSALTRWPGSVSWETAQPVVENRVRGDQTYSKRVAFSKGSIENPVMPEEIKANFRACSLTAAKALKISQISEAAQFVLDLVRPKAMVSAGDSATLKQIGILDFSPGTGSWSVTTT